MNKIVNVGITDIQKERIIKLLKYGESINKFVQIAVQRKLENERKNIKRTSKNRKIFYKKE